MRSNESLTPNGDRKPDVKTLTDADSNGFGLRTRIITASAVAGLLLIGGGSWSVLAKLSSAVIAPGQVVVEKSVKKLQHRQGGIVAKIMIRNGDRVQAGDVLIRLSDTQVKSELDIVQSQLTEYGVRRRRLVAERSSASTIDFSTLKQRSEVEIASAIQGESRIFEDNRKATASQIRQLRLRVEQLRQEVMGLTAQHKGKTRELQVVRNELKQVQRLYERKLATIARVNVLMRDKERLSGDAGGLTAQIARTEGQISEVTIKIDAIVQTARQEAQRELRSVDAKLSELTSRYVAAKDRLARMEMRAPTSGLVHELSVHTVGGVIAAGETVAIIVPETDNLTVEAKFSPVDIDQIIIGQNARLRFSAFNQRTTPEVTGSVVKISADVTHDNVSGQNFYLGQISIKKTALEELGHRKMLPGMPVEVFITTREHTALSYLTKPFTDQLQRTFREE